MITEMPKTGRKRVGIISNSRKMKYVISLAFAIAFSLSMQAEPVLPHKGMVQPNKKTFTHPQEYKELKDIFSTMDLSILRSKNESRIAEYLSSRNYEIINYLKEKYPNYGPYNAIDIKDPATTWLGLICAIYEGNNWQTNFTLAKMQIPEWLSCALGVVGASFGITDLITSLGTFAMETTWKVVKFVVKKYVSGWLGTAIALVQIADECF
jgi:hypothetical protein